MVKIYPKSAHQQLMATPLALKCFSEGDIEIVLLKLEKGETIPMHKNPFDVLFLVKSGSGVLTVEQNNFNLEENELAFVSLTDDRAWINLEEKPLELVVVKLMNSGKL